MASRRPSSPPTPVPAPYRPYRILAWLFHRFFRHIEVEERWREQVRDAASRGVVVHVMRSISFLDFHCLDYLLNRLGLPAVRFVNDLGLSVLEPFGKGFRRMRLQKQVPEDRALAATIRRGWSALLFLRRPPRLGQPARRGGELEVDLIRTLVEAQRAIDEPILLLPQTFVWSKRPARARRTLVDLVFGPTEWPGRIRVLLQFLLNYRNARLRSGEPFALKPFLEEHQDLTDAQIADKVRYALLRRMERERTLVLGPTAKTPQRIREEMLRSPRVRRHLEAHTRSTGRSLADVQAEARRELTRLCAAQDPTWVNLLHHFLDWLWHRIYDGLEIDEAGIARVREAGRKGALVFVPSHRSHIDYLVLGDVLYRHGLSVPLVAAGDNLSFWPLGPIFRRGGAFFIRRSFKGKRLYAALVDGYLRKLLVEGFSIWFFIEGGRSRTGKALPPKFGLLSMIVDAALRLRNRKVFFVPVSVGYERIVEERSYVRELSGEEKQKENIGGLLRTPKVLRSKYGRVYAQFGEIVDLDDVAGATRSDEELEREDEELPVARRATVQQLGHRVMYEIARATVVTPAALLATVLLAHPRRGISRADARTASHAVLDALRRMNARVAPALLDGDGRLRPHILDEAAALFADGKLLRQDGVGDEVIYSVPDDRRLALEYSMNSIVHFFVPSALIAAALAPEEAPTTSVHALRDRVRGLSRLFKHEFMFRADAAFETIFDDALAAMLARGELERMVDHVRPTEDPDGAFRLRFYQHTLRAYFEGYRVAVRAAEGLDAGPQGRKEWVRRAIALGHRLYLEGQCSAAEAASKPRLENALLALRDLGLVQLSPDGSVALRGEPGVRDALAELEQRLGVLARPREP